MLKGGEGRGEKGEEVIDIKRWECEVLVWRAKALDRIDHRQLVPRLWDISYYAVE